MIAIAGGGVAGWIVADEPIVATVCVVAADLIGAAMMVPKTYRDPESETLVDVRVREPRRGARRRRRRRARRSLLLYPIYYCLVNRRDRAAHPSAATRPSPDTRPIWPAAKSLRAQQGLVVDV